MKKTFLKKLVTASIAAVTALSVFRGVPTFADENSDATAISNTETDVQVSINKVLNIAEGITTPLLSNPKLVTRITECHMKQSMPQMVK